jgi:glycerol 2-dehydrogenase (NADP+)
MGEPGGGQRVYNMCANALKVEYRHFDTADGYSRWSTSLRSVHNTKRKIENEEEVGRAIKDSGIPREEIFITTKLSVNYHHIHTMAAQLIHLIPPGAT